MTINIDGVDIEVELKVGPSARVQNLDGTWSTHLGVTPVIVGGPRGPGPDGEPMPIVEAA